MALLLLEGDWLSRPEYVAHLVDRGYTLQSASSIVGDDIQRWRERPVGVAAVLEQPSDAARAADVALQLGVSWLAWDRRGEAALAAYRAGAVVALPPESSPVDLERAVATSMADPAGRGQPVEGQVLSYRATDVMDAGEDSVVEVLSGVVAMRSLQPDGSEVLMGLFGPGDLLVGHPTDFCRIDFVAHVDAEVSVRTWEDSVRTIEFADKMKRSLVWLNGWSAMQVRVRVEHRITGILSLLVERFRGTSESGWQMLDVRLTHQNLADAVGATRSTVSREIQEMERNGVIRTVGSGDYRRIFLRMDLVHGTRRESSD